MFSGYTSRVMVRIQLFGTPQIEADGQPLRLVRRKSRGLVFFLAAHDQPVPRERLVSVFWPDTPRPAALQVLRTSLHGLRQALGAALTSEADRVGISAEVEVDARLLAGIRTSPQIDPARWEAILQAYRGEFLEDFSLPDAQPFEDWLTVEREHYRRSAIRGWTRLSSYYEAQEDYQAALASLDQALALDPLQEDLQREAIRLQTLVGDRPGAIRRYDELRRLLDDEMGIPPMAETRRLYDAIVTDQLLPQPGRVRQRSTPSGPGPGLQGQESAPRASAAMPFVGRSHELERLKDLARRPALILIEGEPGIGKTRLAEEFMHGSGRLCLVGRSRELEQALPYQPVTEALRSLRQHPGWPQMQTSLRQALSPVWQVEIGRIMPDFIAGMAPAGPAYPAAEESRLWEGLHQFLTALARLTPAILFIDDLHWADAATLGVLGYLVRQAQEGQLLFLATTRAIAPRSTLSTLVQSLTRDARLERVALSRLSVEEVQAIARKLFSGRAQDFGEWLYRNSEGNPYILAEVVRELAHQAGEPGSGAWIGKVPKASLVPQTVFSLIQSRLQKISETARRLLDAAVAAGRDFEFEVVFRAAGVSESAALDAMDELLASELIHPLDGQHFSFDHSLTMEVAYQDVGELRHRRLHRRVAEALESLHPDHVKENAWLLAFHYSEAGVKDRAAAYAYDAGQQAVRLAAWAEAVSFFEMALNNAAEGQRRGILIALGEALTKAGRFVQASQCFQEALLLTQDEARLHERVAIQLLLARSLIPQARFGEISALVEEIRRSGSGEELLGAEITLGAALSIEGSDLAGAEQHLREAERLALGRVPAVDLVKLAQIRFELGSVKAQQGDLIQAVQLYRESLQAAQQAPEPDSIESQILALNNLAYHSLLLGDAEAGRYARQGLEMARESGNIGMLPYLLSTSGEISLAQGELEAAEGLFKQGLALADQLGVKERVAGLTANLGLVAKARGDTSLAIHYLSAALSQADALGTHHLAAQARVWLAPLLPVHERRLRLAEARAMAEGSGRSGLLAAVRELE